MVKQSKKAAPRKIKLVPHKATQPKTQVIDAALPPRMVVDTTLTLEYETKNSEYVFGDELSDGFISVTLPKDRFVDKPTTIRVKIDLIN